MQTFLPMPDFAETARVLDRSRLGEQRVEAWIIYQTLTGQKAGWEHHPCVKMWKGYENALLAYYNAILKEWASRGYRNIILSFKSIPGPIVNPHWLGSQKFHLSHQSNLVRKMPLHYRRFFPDVPDNLPYVWPGK